MLHALATCAEVRNAPGHGLDTCTHRFSPPTNGMNSALLLIFPSNTIRVDPNHFQYNLAISSSTRGGSPPGVSSVSAALTSPLSRSSFPRLPDLLPVGGFHSSESEPSWCLSAAWCDWGVGLEAGGVVGSHRKTLVTLPTNLYGVWILYNAWPVVSLTSTVRTGELRVKAILVFIAPAKG